MVLGLEKAREIVNQSDLLEAYFVYSDSEGEMRTAATSGIAKSIVE
jgi:hypothetical protein